MLFSKLFPIEFNLQIRKRVGITSNCLLLNPVSLRIYLTKAWEDKLSQEGLVLVSQLKEHLSFAEDPSC